MRKYLIALLFCPLAFSACQDENSAIPDEDFVQAESINAFECINAQADNPPSIDNARKWIVGEWQLKGVITMLPTEEVPNWQVEFLEDGGVMVKEKGEVKWTDAYSIVEDEQFGFRALKLVTDDLNRPFSEFGIIKGNVRVCEDELLIDHGMAFDAPAYLFRKIE